MTGDQERTFAQRIAAAAKLDGSVYTEVSDQDSNAQSALLVAALAAGVGLLALAAASRSLGPYIVPNPGTWFPIVALGVIAGWAAGAWLVWFVGSRFLSADDANVAFAALARPLAFASVPLMVMSIVGLFFSVLGPVLGLVEIDWFCATTTQALQAVLQCGRLAAVLLALLMRVTMVGGALAATFVLARTLV